MAIEYMSKRVVEVPDNLEVEIEKDKIKLSNGEQNLVRKLPESNITFKKEGSSIVLAAICPKRRDLALLGTISAHLNNMVFGLTKGFEYVLKLVYSHFPVTLNKKNDKIFIENFLGERSPRIAKILEGVKVNISSDTIVVCGADKEAVGQTAANLELATKIRHKDPKVFQDGLYVVEKRCS